MLADTTRALLGLPIGFTADIHDSYSVIRGRWARVFVEPEGDGYRWYLRSGVGNGPWDETAKWIEAPREGVCETQREAVEKALAVLIAAERRFTLAWISGRLTKPWPARFAGLGWGGRHLIGEPGFAAAFAANSGWRVGRMPESFERVRRDRTMALAA